MRLSALLACLVVCTAGASATAASQPLRPLPKIAASCSDSAFRSGGQTVRTRLCLPDAATWPGPVPAVVVLHGCGGFGALDEILTRDLPTHGIATSLVDYFGLTPPPNRKGFCRARLALENAFPTWERITVAATHALRRQAGVDPQRVGAIGWSLGGGLTLQTAELAPHLFRALVLFSTDTGDAPELGTLGHLPPTLVLAGGQGDARPVTGSIALFRDLRTAGVKAELRFFPHGNHQWKKPGQRDAGERWTLEFLNRYLVG